MAAKGKKRDKGKAAQESPLSPMQALLSGGDEAIEPWGYGAFVLFGLTMLAWGILAFRPGGSLPIWIYTQGRFIIVLLALAVGAWAAVTVFRGRPLIQRKRLWPVVTLAGAIGLAPFPVPYPAPRERAPSHASIQLPVQGTWRVRWGGEGIENNPLVLDPARRFALVLVAEESGSTLLTGVNEALPLGPEDYRGFGAAVLAPSDGTVVALQESLPDGFGMRGPALGNFVVLEVSPGEFLWLSGLRQESVLPAVGDLMVQGAPLAQVGASAARRPTGEPHLALFMASSADPGKAEGIPWRLQAWREGDQKKGPGIPQGGVDWDGTPRGPVIQAPE